jgi:hypothetical protein
MVRRINLFGKDPMAALKLLADEFIRSAVTKIMPVMTPEMTSSNRYRRTAEAARNGNLSKAGAVLDDDSLRSDLGREEVMAQLQSKLHATRDRRGNGVAGCTSTPAPFPCSSRRRGRSTGQ